MPTYEYRCTENHQFEQVQKMSEPPITVCPICGAEAVRAISGGAGLIFKGSGFYITDYGKDGKGARKESESGSAAPAGESKPKADAPAPSTPKAEPAAAPKPAPKADAS